MEQKRPVKGKQRQAMEKAANYLAHCEINEGLNPAKVKEAFQAILTWKKSFVKFMQFKENKQAIKACEEKQLFIQKLMIREQRPINIRVCRDHKHLLGYKGAIILADSLFKMQYEIEARALGATLKDDQYLLSEENRSLRVLGLSPYWTREAGPVEWGHSLSDAEYLPRQFAEVPEGPEYRVEEDEYAHQWNLASEFGLTGNDEVVEDQNSGMQHKPDYEESVLKYGELLIELIRTVRANRSPSIVLARAEKMEEMNIITSWQYYKLRENAAMLLMRNKK